MSLTSYSSEGEDVLVYRLFQRCFPGQDRGIYVDVGAYHPWESSNTALLHTQGWCGVNVDARPGSMDAFELYRPFDMNLEAAVGDATGQATYAEYSRPELNMVCPNGRPPAEIRGAHLVKATLIPVHPIADIVAGCAEVDFLDVDVEGAEQAVLDGWPWDRLRPKVICLEENRTEADYFALRRERPVGTDLRYKDYVPCAHLLCSTLYVDQRRAVWR